MQGWVQYFKLSQGRNLPCSLPCFYIICKRGCNSTTQIRKMRCQLASPDLWNLVLGQTLTKSACLVGWQANCVSCVRCWCMPGSITGLANAAFSVSTAKRGQMQTGKDRIIKWQMLFPQFSCFVLSSSEHSGAACVLQDTSAAEWCFCLKKKEQNKHFFPWL